MTGRIERRHGYDEVAKAMSVTGTRLATALLITTGVIMFNVYMVITGAAGYFYDNLS